MLEPLTIFLILLFFAIILVILMPIYLQRMWQTYVKLALGISVIMSLAMVVEWVVNHVLKEHQRNRIKVLLDPGFDPRGLGYQVTQSKIAIGSGGFWGKGLMKGTQTRYDFVPEQRTDFIFCTIGEGFGFLGSIFLLGLYLFMLFRIVNIAERQRSVFSRTYAYGVASVLFFHIFINIGMTIGIVPVIGIPLPFLSFGGTALVTFTVLLFVLIRLDADRQMILR
jgi:rod shape determining protein RodA